MLARLVEDAKPEYAVVAYDSKEPSFRKEMFPEYKANRGAPPEDLVPQFELIDELIKQMGFPAFRQDGVEADDLIATLTKKWTRGKPDHHVVIVSGDKDLMQLVSDQVVVWDTMKNKVYGVDEVEEKFGVGPEQMRDYLALVGDSSDNIPGVPSIGPKTAVTLLKEHTHLKGVLKAAKDGKIKGKKGIVIAENEEKAVLSADLVELKSDVSVRAEKKALGFQFVARSGCLSFLRELEFSQLVDKWAALYGDGATVMEDMSAIHEKAASQFKTLTEKKKLDQLIEQILKKGQFAVDLETTSLNPRAAEIVGWAVCVDSSVGYYIPVSHRGTSVEQLAPEFVLKKFRPLLESSEVVKIGQNLKYDMSVLLNLGVEVSGAIEDTMVAAYVLDPSGRHGFDALCLKYLDYQPLKYEEVCGKGKDAIGFDQVPVDQATRYAAEDALYTLKLWEYLEKELKSQGGFSVYQEIDLPLVPVLTHLECEGVCLDVGYLKKMSREFEKELAETEKKIAQYTDGAPINLNSPKQIGKLLFDDLKLPVQTKTKTGYSTDAKVLDALSEMHEVPRLLLQYREVAKLKSTYVDALPHQVDEKSGKVHAGFHQTVAATGRLSSSDPNLQNIPIRTEKGQKIRGAFIASPGNKLISADYSQIELRILAHMSGDPSLSESFLKDEDVHARTAAKIFQVDADQVDSKQRSVAKAINFGLMYGKTAFGLAKELKIPRKEAAEMIELYFTRYSGVKAFLDRQIQSVKEKGYSETLSGRRRPLPEIHSKNPMMRNNAERMAMNTPIQGTAADLMKLAMIQLEERLLAEKFQARMIIQVHDEILLDCPEAEVEAVTQLVIDVLEGAMELNVPLKVNAASGRNWMELK